MTCLLILVFSGSSIARSGEKTSVYSLYSPGISDRVSSYCKADSNRTRKWCINMADSRASNVAMITTNVLVFLSNAT